MTKKSKKKKSAKLRKKKNAEAKQKNRGGVKKEPEWRRFEKLVARIEDQLSPSGALVRSPDYLADVETGELREVDASIRIQVGSAPILITVECRRRKDSQDSTWIEQLIQKRRSVGASSTLAVSWGGFSAPARRKAELNGILVKTLSELSDGDLLQWVAQNPAARAEYARITAVELSLELATSPHEHFGDESLDEAARRAFEKEEWDAKIFHADTGACSVNDMIGDLYRKSQIPIPRTSGEAEVLGVNFEPPSPLRVQTIGGVREVKVVKLKLRVENVGSEPIAPASVLTYENPDGTGHLVLHGEWESPEGEKVEFVATRPRPTGREP